MTGLTTWAPNSHALILHLPIGLLATATVVDVITTLRRDPSTTVLLAHGLYMVGTVTLLATYLTGRHAAAEVFTPGLALPVVAEHWERALWCTWYFGLVTAGRIFLALYVARPQRAITTTLCVVSLIGFGLLAATAELGGRLVYEHGVGVAAPISRLP